MSTDRNEVRSAVEVFLDSKHCTLYLDWDITTDTGKAKAIEFITDLWLSIEVQHASMFPGGPENPPEAPETASEDEDDEEPDDGLTANERAFVEGVKESVDVDALRSTPEDVFNRQMAQVREMERRAHEIAHLPLADAGFPTGTGFRMPKGSAVRDRAHRVDL